MPLHHHLPAARYSEAVVANGFVFLSGQVPTNPEADIEAQTADVLSQIDRVLADCGSDKAHIWVWDAWVAPGKAPARACVQAALADAGWKVEIKITALQRTA